MPRTFALPVSHRNFHSLRNELESLHLELGRQRLLFTDFVSSYFTVETMVSRVVDMVGSEPSASKIVESFQRVLEGLDVYSMTNPIETSVIDFTKILDRLYERYPDAFGSVGDKLELALTYTLTTSISLISFPLTDLLEEETESVFVQDLRGQVRNNFDDAVSYLLKHERSWSVAGSLVTLACQNVEDAMKLSDAVLEYSEANQYAYAHNERIKHLCQIISSPSDVQELDKVCDYTYNLLRKNEESLKVFMGLGDSLIGAVRDNCSKIDNYLKLKFPHD